LYSMAYAMAAVRFSRGRRVSRILATGREST
jgi:hypothetical protein